MNNIRTKHRSRILVGPIVLAAMVALAGRAEATTTVSGSELSKSDSASSWKSSSSKVGAFGAGHTESYVVCNSGSSACSGGTNQYANGDSVFHAQMFGGSEFQVGEVYADGNSNDQAAYDVYLGTALVKSATDWVINNSQLNLTYSADVATASFEDFIGPVPVTGSIGLEADAGLTLSGTIASNSFALSATPFLSTTVAASVGLGVKDFSVGISVSCDIIQLSLPYTFTIGFQSNQVTYSNTLYLTDTMLDGSIALYAKALFLEYDLNLFSWNGIQLANVLLFTDDSPVASSVSIDLTNGYKAVGSYSYSDSTYSENGTKYDWYWCQSSDPSCSSPLDQYENKTTLALNSVFGQNGYLEFCVTPKNGYNFGSQACSTPLYLGPEASFINDAGTSNVMFAPQNDQAPSGTCFNFPSSFVDNVGRVYFYTTSDSVEAVLYSGSNCTGTSANLGPVGANKAENIYLSNYNFDDQAASFKLIYGDATSADVQLNLVPEPGVWYAYLNYDFGSDASLSESGSTYTLQVATDSAGDNATTVASGSITSSLGVDSSSPNYDDIPDGDYVDFCVTPSDGFVTGSQSCSGWTPTETRVKWYSGESWTGSWLPVSVANGACQDIASVTDSYVGTPKSLTLQSPSTSSATIHMFTGSGCSGSEVDKSAGTGTYHNINLDTAGISNIASYYITW